MVKPVVLVDSSVWIEWLSPQASEALKRTLQALLEAGRIVTTDMIRLEIITGARSLQEFAMFQRDFDAIPCLEMTRREWRRAEVLSFALSRRGWRVAAPDLLIAVAALAHGVLLWHADNDFERVKRVAADFRTWHYPKQSPDL